ncbi:TOPRIM nucleotidyl transferase/hydrolase domain-containing protein [Candidatus Nitrospira nitrosa]|uniref:TOPRIM nucleotidyl transferase/hydrolase domain-containing protein n=1 Tax=Candidatus Nitrospira nitrosa TaxID=1742972 RepID=UPI001FE02F2E|nr:TOPRIM nucleotidyl transferase/hydrolase domain-containing protein [Candidatus Nitrospira nitrosa]
MLRGILEKNKEVSVIRLKRRENGFLATHVSPEILTQATRKPLSRSETILDGLFTEGVVLCESDGDRIVYESVLQTLSLPYPDLRFIPVGGIGGFKETAKLFRALGVPVAIASDFDFLLKRELLDVVCELNETEATVLKDTINGIQEKILEEARGLTFAGGIRRVEETIHSLKSRADQDDNSYFEMASELRSKLNLLSRELSPQQNLKLKGVAAVPKGLQIEINSLSTSLRRIGLFLVPCGELESWVPTLMAGMTRENKSLWATEAARKIEDHGEGEGDIWEYIRSIVDYFKGA